jgi:murein DD-endopeptidase MepM/ murein hydrolase activator NlpD
MTLYAHCNKVYVKEGDKVTQGQEIAEVGATGNVTGPHLHFEIRKEDRYVDPSLIVNFEG